VKETDNYHTGGGGDEGVHDHDLRSRRSWFSSLRNGIEDLQTNYLNNSTTERLSRRGKEFVDEHVPSFSRALAAGSTPHIALAMLVALTLFSIVHWVLQPPSTGMSQTLVPAPSLCASQDDMYDTASRLCQVGNKYAYWYLRNKNWVQCAPNIPGYKYLLNTENQGSFTYPFAKAKIVREFYDTCIPECATDEDTYHASKDLCMVSDGVLITWLNGDGQYCAKGSVGETAIRRATASLPAPRNYWYAPDAANKVRELLQTCHGACAQFDAELHDHAHCQVLNSLALHFLQGQDGTCDTTLPGYRLIRRLGTTKDVAGSFMYPKSTGDEVQNFYLSCMKGWSRKGRAGVGALPHAAETIQGKSINAYEASRARQQEMKRWDQALMMSDY